MSHGDTNTAINLLISIRDRLCCWEKEERKKEIIIFNLNKSIY